MKSPSFPKHAKPVDLFATVKAAITREKKKAGESDTAENKNNIAAALDHMRNQYIINAWAVEFGMADKSAAGAYFLEPGDRTADVISLYHAAWPAAIKCAEFSLRYSAQSGSFDDLLKFYGKFNSVRSVYELLENKMKETSAPGYGGLRVIFKALSYEFDGKIMEKVPYEFRVLFDVGLDHYTVAFSEDLKTATVGGEEKKTIKVEEFETWLNEILESSTKENYVDPFAL